MNIVTTFSDSAGTYHHIPVCEHGVEPLVLELPVEVGSDVSLGVEHLQAHAAKHAMKPWYEKQQLLYKPVWARRVSIHFEQEEHRGLEGGSFECQPDVLTN